MANSPTSDQAETAFRELLTSRGLPQPDEVIHEDGELLFLWHDRKAAVVVELDG